MPSVRRPLAMPYGPGLLLPPDVLWPCGGPAETAGLMWRAEVRRSTGSRGRENRAGRETGGEIAVHRAQETGVVDSVILGCGRAAVRVRSGGQRS